MKHNIISSVCLALILTACASSKDTKYSYQVCCGLVGFIPGVSTKTVQLRYPGPALPLEDVGVVSYNADLSVRSVKDSNGNLVNLFHLYGKKGSDTNGRKQEHFLPGIYTFNFVFYVDSYQQGVYSVSKSISDIEKTIEIKRGDIIHFTYVVNGRNWSIVMKDDSAEKNQVKADYEEAIQLPIN